MTTGPAFFTGWSAIWRVVVAVAITYVAMLTMLRISGKRTLAQTNVFDFVFIITLGSMAANTILSGSIAIAEGLVAIAAVTRQPPSSMRDLAEYREPRDE